jgi:hypothetical protein
MWSLVAPPPTAGCTAAAGEEADAVSYGSQQRHLDMAAMLARVGATRHSHQRHRQ